MFDFEKLKLRTKLVEMLALPFLGLLTFTALGICEKVITLRQMNLLTKLGAISAKAGAAVHELQKERGLSSGFVRSAGGKFCDELAATPEEMNGQAQELQQAVSFFKTEADDRSGSQAGKKPRIRHAGYKPLFLNGRFLAMKA